MEPKFQSSFIPKGPVSIGAGIPSNKPTRKGGLYSYIAVTIFIISFVLAVGTFGYKFFVKGTINRMSEEIAERRNTLIPSSSSEFIRINNRIKSTQNLINNHVVISPIFDYLETSTVKSLRFKELTYNTTPTGVELILRGEASGYAAIALQADIFEKGGAFKSSTFSDLSLDEEGNVTFMLKTMIEPSLISYLKQMEGLVVPPQPAVTGPTATSSVATSTSQTSTSTTTDSSTSTTN